MRYEKVLRLAERLDEEFEEMNEDDWVYEEVLEAVELGDDPYSVIEQAIDLLEE